MTIKEPTLMVLGAEAQPMRTVLEQATRLYMSTLMSECHGNITHVARIAGLHRSQVYKIAIRLGLDYQGKRDQR